MEKMAFFQEMQNIFRGEKKEINQNLSFLPINNFDGKFDLALLTPIFTDISAGVPNTGECHPYKTVAFLRDKEVDNVSLLLTYQKWKFSGHLID